MGWIELIWSLVNAALNHEPLRPLSSHWAAVSYSVAWVYIFVACQGLLLCFL